MPKNSELSTQVLVVGAGPAGLCTALSLARNGIDVTVMDRREPGGELPRAFALTTRTMELFRSAGIETPVREAAAGFGDVRTMATAASLTDPGFRLVTDARALDHQSADLSPTSMFVCPQPRYEAVLADAARAHGAAIHRRALVESVTQDVDGVTAVVSRDGDRQLVRASYLVAADGAASPIRHRLGIDRDGAGTIIVGAASILFRADLTEAIGDREFFLCLLTGPRVRGVLIPMPDTGLAVLSVSFDPRHEKPDDFTDDRCLELIREAVGTPTLPARIVQRTTWSSGMHIAERFGDKRVFLVGDAAHQMTPAGGFGANAAMQSADNLAWKLAAVLRGWAGPSLLATYETERRPVAWATAEQAAMRTRTQLRPDSLTPDETANLCGDLAVSTGYRYPEGAVIGADSGPVIAPVPFLDAAPGNRAPHLWLRDVHGRTRSTIDLFGGALTLLTGPTGTGWLTAVRDIAATTSTPLRGHRIVTGEPSGDDTLTDVDHRWHDTYRLPDDGAVLVRPDGHIAWRHDLPAPNPPASLRNALDRVLFHHPTTMEQE